MLDSGPSPGSPPPPLVTTSYTPKPSPKCVGGRAPTPQGPLRVLRKSETPSRAVVFSGAPFLSRTEPVPVPAQKFQRLIGVCPSWKPEMITLKKVFPRCCTPLSRGVIKVPVRKGFGLRPKVEDLNWLLLRRSRLGFVLTVYPLGGRCHGTGRAETPRKGRGFSRGRGEVSPSCLTLTNS